MADRVEMFGPTRGFSGMADSMEPCKMLLTNPCCHGNEIWARRGDPVAYWLVIIIIRLVCSFNNIQPLDLPGSSTLQARWQWLGPVHRQCATIFPWVETAEQLTQLDK